MLTALLTAESLQVLLPLLAAGLAFFLKSLFGDRANKAQSNFAWGVKLAYLCVAEISARTETKVDDKVALGLGFLRSFLEGKGQELTPADVAQARLLFQAMHGAEKLGSAAPTAAVP